MPSYMCVASAAGINGGQYMNLEEVGQTQNCCISSLTVILEKIKQVITHEQIEVNCDLEKKWSEPVYFIKP